MANFNYGELRVLWLGVVAVISAVGAAMAGEGVVVVLSLLGLAGIIFFLAWRRLQN